MESPQRPWNLDPVQNLDCDVLNDSDTDLKIVIYTTAPGSEDATKLDLARVAGISQDSPTALPADVS